MRKFLVSALLGLGVVGTCAALPGEANASWLSEFLDNAQIQVNIGSQYPAYRSPVAVPVYPQPVYAPPPVYPTPVYAAPVYQAPVYRVPSYPVQTYLPAPVYRPAPNVPAPVYRPAPVQVPQHANYGPNSWDRRDWRR